MNATIDLQALRAIVYGRLKTDAEGASVRAALGDGADSIISAEELKRTPLPATPFIALRRGPMPIVSEVVYAPIFTWWVYDDAQQDYWRIDSVLTLIGKAYAARLLDSPPGGAINVVDGSIGPHTSDDKLGGLLVCTYQIIPYA